MQSVLTSTHSNIIGGNSMKKVKTKVVSVILCMCLLFSCQIVAFAAETWSDAGTYTLSSDTDWKRNTTAGIYLVNTKTTTSTQVSVYTVSKTMASNPRFRMVNSNNSVRSGTLVTAAEGKSKTDSSNTGEKGYNYYASVKSAWNQTADNQSIRIQFKSY